MRSVVVFTLLACIAQAAEEKAAETKTDQTAETQDDTEMNENDITELMNSKEFSDKFAERFITKLFDKMGASDLMANQTSEELTNQFAEKFINKLYDRVSNLPELNNLGANLYGDDENNHQMTQEEADQAAADALVAAAQAWATVAELAGAMDDGSDAYDLRALKADDDAYDNDDTAPVDDDEREEYDSNTPEEEELMETPEEEGISMPAAAMIGAFTGSALTLVWHGIRTRKAA